MPKLSTVQTEILNPFSEEHPQHTHTHTLFHMQPRVYLFRHSATVHLAVTLRHFIVLHNLYWIRILNVQPIHVTFKSQRLQKVPDSFKPCVLLETLSNRLLLQFQKKLHQKPVQTGIIVTIAHFIVPIRLLCFIQHWICVHIICIFSQKDQTSEGNFSQ